MLVTLTPLVLDSCTGPLPSVTSLTLLIQSLIANGPECTLTDHLHASHWPLADDASNCTTNYFKMSGYNVLRNSGCVTSHSTWTLLWVETLPRAKNILADVPWGRDTRRNGITWMWGGRRHIDDEGVLPSFARKQWKLTASKLYTLC